MTGASKSICSIQNGLHIVVGMSTASWPWDKWINSTATPDGRYWGGGFIHSTLRKYLESDWGLTDFRLGLIPDEKHIQVTHEAWHQIGDTCLVNQYRPLDVPRPLWFKPFCPIQPEPYLTGITRCSGQVITTQNFNWICLLIHGHQSILVQVISISKRVK